MPVDNPAFEAGHLPLAIRQRHYLVLDRITKQRTCRCETAERVVLVTKRTVTDGRADSVLERYVDDSILKLLAPAAIRKNDFVGSRIAKPTGFVAVLSPAEQEAVDHRMRPG